MNEIFICKDGDEERITFDEFKTFVKIMKVAKKTVYFAAIGHERKRFQHIVCRDIIECGTLIAFAPVDLEDDTWDKMKALIETEDSTEKPGEDLL
jgi:putative SOS response-associated peptidase YedK